MGALLCARHSIIHVTTHLILTNTNLWGHCALFSFSNEEIFMERLRDPPNVTKLVNGGQCVTGTKAPICASELSRLWVTGKGSLYLSPLVCCHCQLPDEQAEKHVYKASSCLFAGSHFPECEMCCPPASHNMALLCLIRHRLLVNTSSLLSKGEMWGLCLHPSLLLSRVPGAGA